MNKCVYRGNVKLLTVFSEREKINNCVSVNDLYCRSQLKKLHKHVYF